MEWIVEAEKRTPVIADADVIVCGGVLQESRQRCVAHGMEPRFC